MRAYVVATGVLFGLIVIAHIARLVAEGTDAFRSPVFVVASLLAIGMVAWSVLVLLRLRRKSGGNSLPDV